MPPPVTLSGKSEALRLLIAPAVVPPGLTVVPNEPLVVPLLVTPPLVVRALKLNVQFDLTPVGWPLPASEQLWA